ncbi:DUF3224 domain-containing protein [Amycolatopsis taiwanensis]|nr:DUF3224 domain-containing protein [Amycolatopsis taiwanensis]
MTDTFTVQGWTENIVSGGENAPRFAHAHVTFGYTGVIEGSSTCDYLMYYPGEGHTDQKAPGFERIEGTVEGRKGSFVLRHEVGYGAEGVQGTFIVVPGSGTGDLAGIRGTGTVWGSSRTMNYTFDYKL